MADTQRELAVVRLSTNDSLKLLVLSNFNGNQKQPYQCDLRIKSGAFGFDGRFWFDNFLNFISAIDGMDEKLTGFAELKEDYKDQYIKLEMSNLGHVLVSGSIEQHSGITQSLEFGFRTDQTCLSTFSRDLREIVAL